MKQNNFLCISKIFIAISLTFCKAFAFFHWFGGPLRPTIVVAYGHISLQLLRVFHHNGIRPMARPGLACGGPAAGWGATAGRCCGAGSSQAPHGLVGCLGRLGPPGGTFWAGGRRSDGQAGGWSVGRSVGWSVGRAGQVSPGPRLSGSRLLRGQDFQEAGLSGIRPLRNQASQDPGISAPRLFKIQASQDPGLTGTRPLRSQASQACRLSIAVR
jgi:hypothetical protein